MEKNRSLAYGYKILSGKILAVESEKDMINEIYNMYASGMSYKKISDSLTLTGVRYMESKPEWNKNMIARILKNENYLGNSIYPQLINKDLYNAAQKAMKPYAHTQSEDIKVLKKYFVCEQCGGRLKRIPKGEKSERWCCENDKGHISNKLSDAEILTGIANLQTYMCNMEISNNNNQVSLEIIRLQNEIERLLQIDNYSVEKLKSDIKELAELKYSNTIVINYREIKIRKILSKHKKLNAILLKEIAKEITIEKNRVKAMTLNSGIEIKGGI